MISNPRQTINHPPTSRRVKVLIVDDSLVFRRFLLRTFEADPMIEVVGEAASAEEAQLFVSHTRPDVITLDLEMPGQGGMAFLRKTIAPQRIPTIVISSQTIRGARQTIEALEAGAVDVLAKPSGLAPGAPDRMALEDIATRAKAVAGVRMTPRTQEVPRPAISAVSAGATRDWVIVIGASTGGVQALTTLLQSLPLDCPPVAIVQHMPEGFTQAFAQRLNNSCTVEVREAAHGDTLRHGLVLVAPGGTRHMHIKRGMGLSLEIDLQSGDPVCFSRPSVDVLFQSAAQVAGARVSAAVLTGMGGDGANGLLALRQAGAQTFAQDEASSLIYGMPARAWENGGAQAQVALEQMADRLLASVGTTSARHSATGAVAASRHF